MGFIQGGMKLHRAMTAKRINKMRPILPKTLCRKIDHPSKKGPNQRVLSVIFVSGSDLSALIRHFPSVSDPRVQVGIEDINDQIGDKDNNGDKQERGLGQRIIIVAYGKD